MRVPQWAPGVLAVVGWIFVVIAAISLIGHAIHPTEWPEVPSLGKAGGFVLDLMSLAFGLALLFLRRYLQSRPSGT